MKQYYSCLAALGLTLGIITLSAVHQASFLRETAAEARPARVHVRAINAQVTNPLPDDLSGQVTWMEDPSLMDTSWRRWPSLTDF